MRTAVRSSLTENSCFSVLCEVILGNHCSGKKRLSWETTNFWNCI